MENNTESHWTVASATKIRDDHTKTLDDVSANKWNDRVYVNGLFTSSTDVYVTLTDGSATVSGSKTRWSKMTRDGDEIELTIKRPSCTMSVTLVDESVSHELPDDDDVADEEDDSDVDLERFGVTI